VTDKEFFKVTSMETALQMTRTFPCVSKEVLPLGQCVGRILSQDIVSKIDLPEFNRATMDGYAVQARSTFGASESMPALFTIVGAIEMGEVPTVSVKAGEAVRIATGGMLPDGADSVVMIGEDFRSGEKTLLKGSRIRPQEMGVLAALGETHIPVYRKPVVTILSSGDEIVPIDQTPDLSQLRDVNAYTLTGLVQLSGAVPRYLGIARDSFDELHGFLENALAEADVVLISGGSSVGSRDFTIEAIQALADAEILFHGVSISPGKPTILACSKEKAIWGLPGQVTSAMVVLHVMVRPMLERIGGLSEGQIGVGHQVSAVLSRNLASVQGREDYVRVKLVRREDQVYAEPILGKSGLIHTMVKGDGLVRIDMNSEGLNEGTPVSVILF